ncbi:transposase [Pseudoalteromonas sp. MMG005]|uniref:transposase n=1 Tax=Pseudoalteromonas sp. MMG005 TaxID=2822682 RepID=UPI001B3A558F|nr:transposase [Pseudoalteromonas sp. MMG005]
MKLVSYIARYTRKGLIPELRLVSVNEQSVCFKYRDYADKHSEKVMTLSCKEFLRRYLQHVLPKGFMRIRHYGFLANACCKRTLALIKGQEPNLCKVKKKKAEAASPPSHWPCEVLKIGVLRFNERVNSSEETMK